MSQLNPIVFMIIFFGTINIIRMGFLLVGSDIYSLRSHLLKKKRITNKNHYFPSVSVVIPAHNEEKTIIRAIKSVLENTYPKTKLEVIVVDDGSTDNTYRITNLYKKAHGIENITIVKQTSLGKAHALNNGIRNFAKGDLIMCLDSDSMIAKNAIENAVQYFRDPKVKGLSANVKIIDDGTLLNFIQKFEYIVCYQMKRAQTLFNIEYIIGGIGSMFRKEVLEEVGYYDTNTVTEDIDLTMKIIKEGNKKNRVVYGDDVIAYTESCLTVGALIRQRYRWKWGRSQTFFKNIFMFFNTHQKYTKPLTVIYLPFAIYGDIAFFFEPILVGYIFFITILYKDIYTLLSACLVLSFYVLINILAEDTLTIKERLKLIPFTPIMYFLFYVLSFAEYVALIKTLIHLPQLKRTIDEGISSWQHVERSGRLVA